eukprot:3347029-Pyramimonas_sp.AAC.1
MLTVAFESLKGLKSRLVVAGDISRFLDIVTSRIFESRRTLVDVYGCDMWSVGKFFPWGNIIHPCSCGLFAYRPPPCIILSNSYFATISYAWQILFMMLFPSAVVDFVVVVGWWSCGAATGL